MDMTHLTLFAMVSPVILQLQKHGLFWFCWKSQFCDNWLLRSSCTAFSADLARAGSERSVIQYPMAVRDDVLCAPEEFVVLSCSGVGDQVGKPL